MGVTNLLQFLRYNEKNVSIKKYSGCVAAIDAMCWIHRGLISSAVANVRNEVCDKYIKFILSMIQLLIQHNIVPIMVFDGYEMPAKKAENNARRERRTKAREEALEMIKKNNNKVNSEIMRKCMQAIQITPEIVHRVIAFCKKINVSVIVSPYEADAQVSYLCRSGIADFAISEDSDLVVYGCPVILYKLNKDGKCVELRIPFFNKLNQLNEQYSQPSVSSDSEPTTQSSSSSSGELSSGSSSSSPPEFASFDERKVFDNITYQKFVIICVLSGTDYDNNCHISGIGLKIAYKLILQYNTLDNLLYNLLLNNKYKLPENINYENILLHYKNVKNIFLYNIVFDPLSNTLVHISDTPQAQNQLDGKSDYSYIFEMCDNLYKKEVDFVKIAHGLVSVHDHQEINYSLTESDLAILQTIKHSKNHQLFKINADANTKFNLLLPNDNSYSLNDKVKSEDVKVNVEPPKPTVQSILKLDSSFVSVSKKGDDSKSRAKFQTKFQTKSGPKLEPKSQASLELNGFLKRKVDEGSSDLNTPVLKKEVSDPGNLSRMNKSVNSKLDKDVAKVKVETKRNNKRGSLEKLLENTETYVVKRAKN